METPKFKTFGEWLLYWRKFNDFTQPEVGKRADVSAQQISNLERGEPDSRTGKPATPSIEVLVKLTKLFKRPIAEPISLIVGTKVSDIPEAILDEIDLKDIGREDKGLLNQQVFRLHSLFLQLPADRRPFVIELMELVLAGVLAGAFNQTLSDALTSPAQPLDHEVDLDEYEEEGKQQA